MAIVYRGTGVFTRANSLRSRCKRFCFVDDKNLPSVPPLQLSIPADYPDQSPHWEDDGQQYGEPKSAFYVDVNLS